MRIGGACRPDSRALSTAGAPRPQAALPIARPQTSMAVRPGCSGSPLRAQASPQATQGAITQAEAPSTSNRPSFEAKDVIMHFYDRYNAGDIDGVMAVMASDCEYHDMIYGDPFVGTEEIRAYFEKVVSIVPPDLKFRVDQITSRDPRFVGVKWHVDLAGNPFPFSRGASFYEVNGEGRIVAARDCVEPALKPGSSALQGLKVMTPIVRKLGPKADPGILKTIPFQSYAIWAAYAGYVAYVFLSTSAPGEPLYRTPPETWQWIFWDSINFFYVNIAAAAAGLPSIPTPPGNPVSEALFNFVNAWGLLFWPLLLADRKRDHVPKKWRWWLGIMFLTNVFFVPYMALRARPVSDAERKREAPAPPPNYGRLIGGASLVVGCVSLVWVFAGRPEFGGFDARWAYAAQQFGGNRAFWAFVLDLGFYSLWQAILLGDAGAPRKFRYVPFFGLAAWLLAGRQPTNDERKSS